MLELTRAGSWAGPGGANSGATAGGRDTLMPLYHTRDLPISSAAQSLVTLSLCKWKNLWPQLAASESVSARPLSPGSTAWKLEIFCVMSVQDTLRARAVVRNMLSWGEFRKY